MFLLIHSKYNIGLCGGYSHHGMSINRIKKKADQGKNIAQEDDDDTTKEEKPIDRYTHGSFAKGQFGYVIYNTNNLNISVEGILGYTFGKVEENNKVVFDTGFFGGIVGKFELDFDEVRSLYMLLGLQVSHPSLHTFTNAGEEIKFPNGENDEFRITPVIGFGGSMYLTKKCGLFCEITHSGYFSGHYVIEEIAASNGINQKFYAHALRFGAGLNFRF